MAWVGEQFPLECPGCGGDIRLILGGGDRKTLTPGGNVADNNHIHHYGRWNRMYRNGIAIDGVGNRAAHNLFIDCTPAVHVDARGLGWAGAQHPVPRHVGRDRSHGHSIPHAPQKPAGHRSDGCWDEEGRNFWLRVWHELPRRGRQRRAGDLDDHRRGERRFGEPPPDEPFPPRLPSRSAAGRPLPKCL